MVLALVGATVFDGRADPRPNIVVLIEHGRIIDLTEGDGESLSGSIQRLELPGMTILPGIIDCHIHYGFLQSEILRSHQHHRPGHLAALTVAALRRSLESGVTSAVDLGGLDAGYRDAVELGVIPGPSLQTSVGVLGPTNGVDDPVSAYGLRLPPSPGHFDSVFDGPVDARRRVREALRGGADIIKIAVTGAVSAPRTDPLRQLMTGDELEAIVDEAHRAGVGVACHALGGPGALLAVQAGVNSIEHGCYLTEDCLVEMADRGTWLVPTFAEYKWHSELGGDVIRSRASGTREPHRRVFERALELGIPIALGSDAGGYGHDSMIELDLLVDAGMTELQALSAGTRLAADCRGIGSEVGTLEPGKRADVLVIDGSPFEHIELMRDRARLALVLKGGVPVGGSLSGGLDANVLG